MVIEEKGDSLYEMHTWMAWTNNIKWTESDLGIQIKLPQYFLFFSFSPGATLREAEQKNCSVVMEIQIRTKMKSTQ